MRFAYKMIPWVFTIFLLLIILADGVFVYLAQKSHSGLVANVVMGKSFYKRFAVGSNANHYAPFTCSLSLQRLTDIGQCRTIVFLPQSQEKEHLDLEKVVLRIMSPVTSKYDQEIIMNQNQNGDYEAYHSCSNGQWEVEIFVALQKSSYIMSKRVVLSNEINEINAILE
jgi:nitrogen fixation protein FixH